MSIKTITAGLSKMVRNLEKFQEKQQNDSFVFRTLSESYDTKRVDAERSAVDAARIAKKISALIE